MKPFTAALLLTVVLAGEAVSQASPVSLNAGDTLPLFLQTVGLTLRRCYIITPKGEEVDFYPTPTVTDETRYIDTTSVISQCSVNVLNLTAEDTGVWTLKYVTDEDILGEVSHNIIVGGGIEEAVSGENESAETGDVESNNAETGSNTTSDETNYEIQNKDWQIFNMFWGDIQTVEIDIHELTGYITSCYIQTPDQKQYTVTKDLQIEGVVVNDIGHFVCSVNIQVTSEDVIGNWTLITKEDRFSSNNVEKRFHFTINVQEFVEAVPNEMTIARGGVMSFRLANPIDNPETCIMYGPLGNPCQNAIRDANYENYCGFTLPVPAGGEGGTWEIRYGTKIIYRAPIAVKIIDHNEISSSIHLLVGKPVNQLVGPENAEYCILKDPAGFTRFDGFGNCMLVIDRASYSDAGSWTMRVALPGRVVTTDMDLLVVIDENVSESHVTVSSKVEKDVSEQSTVVLSCAVSGTAPVRACSFRDPGGNVLLAAQGVSDDDYSFYGNGTNYEGGIHSHDCGLRIAVPAVKDLGLWRCAIETEDNTYYGFLTVLCPHALASPAVAALVVTEPTLTAERSEITAVAGETITISCSVQAAIRYCYFRSGRNGTIFNLSPGVSGGIEYAGAGFEAGECSARMTVSAQDSGAWSCHVGLQNQTAPEQRASVTLQVDEAFKEGQYMVGSQLVVEAVVHSSYAVQPLNYCRFVRIDGSGFTSQNVPEGVHDRSILERGVCSIHIDNPNIVDHHPWTVVASVRGHASELTAVTDMSWQPAPAEETDHDEGQDDGGNNGFVWFYVFRSGTILCIILLVILFFAIIFGPKKNRKWTAARFDGFRRSFSTFQKQRETKAPLPA